MFAIQEISYSSLSLQHVIFTRHDLHISTTGSIPFYLLIDYFAAESSHFTLHSFIQYGITDQPLQRRDRL